VNRVEAIRELLRQGADIDARSRDGNAAIHIAANSQLYDGQLPRFLRRQYRLAERRWQHSSGSRGRVWTDAGRRILIAAGADLQIKNKFEKTALTKRSDPEKRILQNC